MYSVLEFVSCVVLVFGGMGALFAASVIDFVLKEKVPILVRVLSRSVQESA